MLLEIGKLFSIVICDTIKMLSTLMSSNYPNRSTVKKKKRITKPPEQKYFFSFQT